MLPTSRRQRFSRGPAQECSRRRKLWVELRSRASSVGAKEKYCATAKTAKLHIQSLRLSDSGAGSECRRPRRTCHPEAPILWRRGTLRHAAIPMLPTSRRQRFSRGPAQECSRQRKLWVELRSRASSVGAKEKYCATAKTAKLHIQSLRLSDSGAGSECRRPLRTCHPRRQSFGAEGPYDRRHPDAIDDFISTKAARERRQNTTNSIIRNPAQFVDKLHHIH